MQLPAFSRSSWYVVCGLLGTLASSWAQERPQIFDRIQGHINEPALVPVTPERVQSLRLPPGFAINIFAQDLEAPRILATGPNGAIYFTRRAPYHDVWMLRDTTGDGTADLRQRVAQIENVHGITFRDQKVYLAAIRNFYVADVHSDGSFGEPVVLYSDLPDAGQHPNRTVRFSPTGELFLSIGSMSNAAPEPNEESATLVRLQPDGSGREIYARGLRNTVGFDWHPVTGELWGMDHNIDWLGDTEHREELNLITPGAHYGWPFIYDQQKFNLGTDPEPVTGMTWAEFAELTTPPHLGLEPHAAPMEMRFYTGALFPPQFRHQAFVAMRGSWNRARPVGHNVMVIHFENGRPVGAKPFLEGFLTADGRARFGRPVGLTLGPEGALYVSDDTGGVIYRITYGL